MLSPCADLLDINITVISSSAERKIEATDNRTRFGRFRYFAVVSTRNGYAKNGPIGLLGFKTSASIKVQY